jgi:hypothetical protein
MSGQAAGHTREEVKKCIKDIECNTQHSAPGMSGLGKMGKKETTKYEQ